jgi:hypothetical protein
LQQLPHLQQQQAQQQLQQQQLQQLQQQQQQKWCKQPLPGAALLTGQSKGLTAQLKPLCSASLHCE